MSQYLRLIAALGLVAWSHGASAKPEANLSWAKSGVSLEEFAADSRECADTSKDTPVYIEPETLKILDALSSAQMMSNLMQMEVDPDTSRLMIVQEISKTNTEADIARRTANFGGKFIALSSYDVRNQLQKSLDQCLMDRGYVRIRLTEKQTRNLSRLKKNTAERTAYLHSIDSDPSVVEYQRIEEDR
ncbi:hypothetical protein [Sphingobium yanoikuyae]|uniref:hypothetical protein n=1 Tax=Sphingobium yanoikuyae TaxID=13690 RepID=UPI0012379218|nr:hypothetical protein [Sphingobium yanoikuyae]